MFQDFILEYSSCINNTLFCNTHFSSRRMFYAIYCYEEIYSKVIGCFDW